MLLPVCCRVRLRKIFDRFHCYSNRMLMHNFRELPRDLKFTTFFHRMRHHQVSVVMNHRSLQRSAPATHCPSAAPSPGQATSRPHATCAVPQSIFNHHVPAHQDAGPAEFQSMQRLDASSLPAWKPSSCPVLCEQQRSVTESCWHRLCCSLFEALILTKARLCRLRCRLVRVAFLPRLRLLRHSVPSCWLSLPLGRRETRLHVIRIEFNSERERSAPLREWSAPLHFWSSRQRGLANQQEDGKACRRSQGCKSMHGDVDKRASCASRPRSTVTRKAGREGCRRCGYDCG
jgi:hypothetical protein